MYLSIHPRTLTTDRLMNSKIKAKRPSSVHFLEAKIWAINEHTYTLAAVGLTSLTL